MNVLDSLKKARTSAVEIGIYGPLGAYDKARDELSDIDRNRIRRVYRDLVRRGERRVRPLQGTASKRRRALSGRTRDTVGHIRRGTDKAQARGRAAGAAIAPKIPRVAAPKRASDLPIDGYASLTADEIVAKTRGLTQTDLAKVYKYERAHEDRTTVLERVESRFVDLPLPTYDALTVEDLNDRLIGLSDAELRTLRSYEKETKARSTVLDRIEELL